MTRTLRQIVAGKQEDAKDYRDLADRYAELGKPDTAAWYRAQADKCIAEAIELKKAATS